MHYAGWTDKLAPVLGGVNPVAAPFLSFSLPEPTGVVGVVAPDEPPLLGLVAEIAPALAAGNTVVAILSESAPLAGLDLAEVARRLRRARRRRQPAQRPPLRAGPRARRPPRPQRDRRRLRRRRAREPSSTSSPPRRSSARATRRRDDLRRRRDRQRPDPPRGRHRAQDGLAPHRRLTDSGACPLRSVQRALEAQDAAQDRQRRRVGRVHPVVAQAAGAQRSGLGVGRVRGVVDDPEVDRELGEVDGLADGMAVGVGDLVDRVAERARPPSRRP